MYVSLYVLFVCESVASELLVGWGMSLQSKE